MQNQPNEAIEDLYAQTLHKVERGAINKGKVLSIKPDGVVVDVGYKSEGVIPASEFTEQELQSLKVGDEVDVFVEKINDHEGVVHLSRQRASRLKAFESLMQAYNNQQTIEATVVEKIKGGLIVNYMGLKGFLPSSQIDIRVVKDLDSYIGKTLTFTVLKVVQPKQSASSSTSFVVSRRVLLEAQREKLKQETLKNLKEGALIKGVVKNITDYGVFVDIGGLDGLLHISDISWRRVTHPSEYFKVGDEGEFIILKYDEATNKATLGYKQKTPDPWLSVDERYAPGMRVQGKVVGIIDYGVFVELEDGLEGLVHISEIDWSPRPKHPSKYYQIGDVVQTEILAINKDERRISLSIKKLLEKPWEIAGKKYKVGDKITGRIKTLTEFGAFVRLPEGIDALIHISDISWTKHIKHASEVFKKGQKVEAVVLNIDVQKERMALGIKQLTEDPWITQIPAKFKQGDITEGKIIKKTDFGFFVELEGGVEGLVYSSELGDAKSCSEGDVIKVRIIKVNLDERKIGLSAKVDA